MTRKEDEENSQIIEGKKTQKVFNIYKKERSNDIECL